MRMGWRPVTGGALGFGACGWRDSIGGTFGIGKIRAVLPPQLAQQARGHSVYPMGGAVYQSNRGTVIGANPAALGFDYTDLRERYNDRTVWSGWRRAT